MARRTLRSFSGRLTPGKSADYIVFGRTKAAFVGISLDGAVVDINSAWNKTYYGKP